MHQVMIIANSIYLLSCLYWQLALAAPLNFGDLELPAKAKERIDQGENYLISQVVSLGEEQRFTFHLLARHPKSCRFALKKLKNYERYSNYIEMITVSRYQEAKKDLYLELDPPIIKENLVINFKIDRIDAIGRYPFRFDQGFLDGLKGSIEVVEYKHRCIFSIRANWQGKKTRYPDKVLSLFAATAAEMAQKRLFRISSSY